MMYQKNKYMLILAIALGGFYSFVLILNTGCNKGYQSIEVDGSKRYYLLYQSAHLDKENAPVSLVLALHQFLDTPRGMQEMTGLNELADKENFVVAYPKGRWRRWESNADLSGRDHRFLSALIEYLRAVYDIPAERVFATGASAGAIMIQSYARHGGRLTAIAPVIGLLTETIAAGEKPSDPPSVLIIHGGEDPVIPYVGGQAGGPHESVFLSAEETAAFWAEAGGCDKPPSVDLLSMQTEAGNTIRRYTYTCADDRQVVLLGIEGLGHTWPGGQRSFFSCIVGPSVNSPSATTLIWEFFKVHIEKDINNTAS